VPDAQAIARLDDPLPDDLKPQRNPGDRAQGDIDYRVPPEFYQQQKQGNHDKAFAPANNLEPCGAAGVVYR